MKITALLPMKSHSERVPNKNMKNFNGSPLYHVIVEVLQKSAYIKKIVVNTDSESLADDATKNFERVHIINRPERIRGDFVSMNTIIAYDLSQLEGEHFLQTHSTNPLVQVETIDKAIEAYFHNLGTYDSLFSVTRLQTRLYRENGRPINHDPSRLIRTQDLPPIFEENSNFYIFSRKSFSDAGQFRIGLKPQLFEINKLEAVDIDEPEDWEIAEVLYKRRVNK